MVSSTNHGSGKLYLPFTVVNASLKDAYIFDVNPSDPTDTSDTTFTYNGNFQTFGNGSLGLVSGDTILARGTDFTVEIFDADGNKCANGPKAAGSYTVVLTGANNYKGSSLKLPLEIEKLNLATTPVAISADGSAAKGAAAFDNIGKKVQIDAIEGYEAADLSTQFKLVANDGVALEKGHYTYTVTLADGADEDAKASVENTATASLDVVDHVATSFMYGSKPFDDTLDRTVNLSNEGHFEFDADKVKVTADNGKTVPSEYVTFEIVNEATGEVSSDPSVINTNGKWLVTVKIDAEKSDWTYGGSSPVATFTVVSGVVKNATMLVTYDDVTANSFTENYTGEDYLDDIKVTVYDSNKNLLTEGEDYTVVVTKDGEAVDSIVDNGTYTITIESDTYKVNKGAKATFTVNPFTVLIIRAAGTFTDQDWFAYTGDVIVPEYEYLYSNDDGILGNDDDVWKALPSDVYTVSYINNKTKKEAEFKEVGEYTANVTISDAKGNFTPADVTTVVEISDDKVFQDVPSGMWYSQSVYNAAKLGYMNGYANSKMFGPEDEITRGQVAVVLFNMAGGAESAEMNFQYDEFSGYKTGFDDVDGKMYYAQAIAWAKAMGIVNGDAGTKNFRPDDKVTAEEFAAMLANYASKQGADVDGAEADLSGYTDGDQVSEWAAQSVEWAVSADVMGNDTKLAPKENIKRARVAAMVVNYQPDGKTDGLMTIPDTL